MNGVIDFLSSLLRRESETVVVGLFALVVGCVLTWRFRTVVLTLHQVLAWIVKTTGGSDQTVSEATISQQKIDWLSRELEELKDASNELAEERTHLALENDRLQRERDQAHEGADRLRGEVEALSHQVEVILKTDGRIWESPPGPGIPEFVPRRKRRATILALVNLKGGVGKTTVTANLGATLALLGKSVLLVDLDHQHSLSDLCFPNGKREELKQKARLIDSYFLSDSPGGLNLYQLAEPVGNRTMSCVACDEPLADIETRAMARWLVQPDGFDVRYKLREGLQDRAVSERFDWILLDCPPRLTTCSINALAAADYVLIPTILDAPSLGAVPRLLDWLTRLKCDSRMCPDLGVMGVLANATSQSPSLTSSERVEWTTLEGSLKGSWLEPVYQFRRFIPHKAAFAHVARAGRENRFAAEEEGVRPIFLDLANEVLQRVPTRHDHQDSCPVSASA